MTQHEELAHVIYGGLNAGHDFDSDLEFIASVLERGAVKWTKERPHVPGWYWRRASSQDTDPVVMNVACGSFGSILHYGTMGWAPVAQGGEWSSAPLAPPEEPGLREHEGDGHE